MNEQMLDAIRSGDYAEVQRLIASGVDVKETSPGRVSYLVHAWGHPEYDFRIIQLLIEHGADVNDAIVDASGRGNISELQYILDRGADINAVSHVGTSALWQVAYDGNVEGIRFLLRNGLSIAQHGGHALQVAASNGQLEAVKLLVEEGADINAQMFDRHADRTYTPLHKAALFQKMEVANFLLESGADPTLKNYYGERPYSLASKAKNKELMDLITSYEPDELHDPHKKAKELEHCGLPMEIIQALGDDRSRMELPDSKYLDYIEFGSILDVTEADIHGTRMLSLLVDVDGYDAWGFLVWLPVQKTLGSYDTEHGALIVLSDVDWKEVLQSPGFYLDRILDGEYEAEELGEDEEEEEDDEEN